VILPDERFKSMLHLYDHLNNLNFAMGFDYDQTPTYKRLFAIYQHWKHYRRETYALLREYGVDLEPLQAINPKVEVEVRDFFEALEPFGMDMEREVVLERRHYFVRLFGREKHTLLTWLFLWLEVLRLVRLDDVRGGKVTVMGALETRGVHFEGGVIVDFNDGIVPAIPAKDAFLNSSLRQFANLPTRSDREALQKQIYKRLLEEAKCATIIYALSNNKMPTGYLYELHLGEGIPKAVDMAILYPSKDLPTPFEDPRIEQFDARAITWSATRLKTFLSCRRKYYYRYVQKIQPKPSEEFNEGAFLHRLLERLFVERDTFANSQEMQGEIARLLESMIEEESPKMAYLKQLWRTKLEGFVSQQITHFASGWRVVDRERHIVGEIGGVRFKGVIDRMDQCDTQTLVLDYKSGSITEANRTKNLEKLTDFQMSIYATLLAPHHAHLTLAFLEIFKEGKITPITALEEKTARLHEVIEELKSMREVVCSRCEEVSLCQYCDYTLLCGRGVYL